jgi:hypothetical protein
MTNVGNSFSLPFKDPQWFSKFLVIGLIMLIPIVGWINMTGWMLATLDNYRQGRTDLPPAGIHYIGRGANVFIVGLVYGVVIALIFLVPLTLLLLALMAPGLSAGIPPDTLGTSPALVAMSPVLGGGGLVIGIIEYTFLPAVVLNTERGGIGGGLNVVAVWRIAAANWKHSLIAGLLIYVAYFIGGFGVYACCVGLVVTFPYSTAVVAGILRYYEATFEPVQAVPPPAGPPTALA